MNGALLSHRSGCEELLAAIRDAIVESHTLSESTNPEPIETGTNDEGGLVSFLPNKHVVVQIAFATTADVDDSKVSAVD